MDRRKEHRATRRLSVRFWRGGEQTPSTGLTNNFSKHGLFIATNRPARSGERVRVEVVDPAASCVIEGVVTHSHNVPPELHRVQPSGMGIRMLAIDELLNGAAQGPRKEMTVALPAAAPGEPTPASQPAPPSAEEKAPPPLQILEDGTYLLRYSTRERFLEVLRRDLQFGELFVPTMRPAKVGETVNLEIEIPGPEPRRERFVGRVVQRVLPLPEGASALASPGVAGMSIELADRASTVARLRRHL